MMHRLQQPNLPWMRSTLTFILIWIGIVSVVPAQDVDIVVMNRPKSKGTMNRKGIIRSWQGSQLIIDLGQRDVTIDQEEIVSVQTNWPIEYSNAISFTEEGKSDLAIQNLSIALQKEDRAWAKNIIRARLVTEYSLVGQVDAAVQQYLTLRQQDRNSRFLHLIPLAWSNSSRQINSASALMQQRDAMAQIIGASWSLNGTGREAAIRMLEELVDDIDPRVSCLARGQLWRTRTTASVRQIEVWNQAVEEMPRTFRAGPRFVLAGLQSRSQRNQSALLNWMRVITQHEDQRDLVAASLYRSISELNKIDPTNRDRSKVIMTKNELNRRFPQSIWAKQMSVSQ